MQDNEKDYVLQQEDAIDIKRYLYVVFMKRRVLYYVVAIFMALDFIYTFKQAPIYRATSLVLIEKTHSAMDISKGREAVSPEIFSPDYSMTQFEILKSKMLAKRVAKALNLGTVKDFDARFPENRLQKMIVVQPIKGTRLVKVSVDYTEPEMATKMVNTLVSSYIEQNIENMLFMSKEILKEFPQDAKEIEQHTIYGQLKDVGKKEAVESLPSVVNNLVVQQLKREKIEVETELANLSERYKSKHPKMVALNTKLEFINSRIDSEVGKILGSIRADLAGRLQANNVRIIDYAEVPKQPIRPKRFNNIVGGFFVSVFLGIGIILLMEYLDSSIKDQEGVENILKLPYLGNFPYLKDASLFTHSQKIVEINQDIKLYEAMGSIKTNILFSMPKGSLKTVLLTSIVPQEGKSLISSCLAVSLAKNGLKTLLLDADVRKPQIYKSFKIPRAPGLVDMLVEDALVETTIKATSYSNLYVLPSGSKTPNPLELLNSEKMALLINELSKRFDKIIIDTPPSFNISDSLVLSKIADVVVLVTKAGAINEKVFRMIRDRFTAAGSRITGVVINFSDEEKSSYYSQKYYNKYYKNYYSADGNKPLSSSESITQKIVA